MNILKFIDYAKEKGISSIQVLTTKGTKQSIKIYHKDVERFLVADSQSLIAMGIYNGRLGGATTEKLDDTAYDFLIEGIKESASISENKDFLDFFKGSEKYKKRSLYSKELDAWKSEDIVRLLKSIEQKLLAYDKRITDVSSVSFQRVDAETDLFNSYGLKLKQKSNYFFIAAGIVAKEGTETKTGYNLYLDCDPKKFDEEKFVKETAEEALKKFGAVQCESKKYRTAIKAEVFADILEYFIGQLSAEEVQKHSSLVEGKIGEKIASTKVNIFEMPLNKDIFYSYFDDEGVAKFNKPLIKKGVLQTYLHNRSTAKKMGVETTANGTMSGSKMGIGYSSIFVKPGRKSFDDMIKGVKEGVYITDIAGLGTGINPRSGDFSCQAEGFMIRDGKLGEPLNLITLSGNLLKMLLDVKEFDSKKELLPSSFTVPDVLIKSMNIGGK
ncbi:MAG TPA: hypothetical protein DCZ41_04475 [Firmicutes bacterium]|nr:hypothetical protein [Bacillota bacterium]